ncbi:hypothetical protein Tsubulata_014523 [Turnera subulata]|uniref:RING-type domain-containing protein n=1 Tax=Turnera subulata TaxID=218843 RepID=A0A9Q0J6J2_9ROSI|nr:hypothetical protein Tsubulata_014523 [Turnera subulata]
MIKRQEQQRRSLVQARVAERLRAGRPPENPRASSVAAPPHDTPTTSAAAVLPTGRVVVYKKGDQENSIISCTTECAICLEDFKDEDSYKILSRCNHVYHQTCIDLWLVKDRHCPLCRGSVRGSYQV